MKKIKLRSPIGLRTAKTAVAVFLSMVLVDRLGTTSSKLIFAMLGALKCDPVTNPVEAQRLIDDLLSCSNAEFTSTGKRIITIIPIDEIDKRF